MAWVKLHDDILGDPKLMRAARMGGTELVLLPWLLAFASKAADHGRLSVGATAAEPEDLAYQIPGVTAAQIEACQRTLVAVGVLALDDDGCLRFTKWEDRQAKPSASKSAVRERVKRHREKRKGGNTPPALHSVTGGENGTQKGHVTPRNATEKRRGEEKREEEKEKHSAVAAEKKPARTTWLTPFCVAWKSRFGGEMTIGPAAAPLSKLVAEHGEAETLERWGNYLGATEARYANPARFAATFGEWAAAPLPKIVDGWFAS